MELIFESRSLLFFIIFQTFFIIIIFFFFYMAKQADNSFLKIKKFSVFKLVNKVFVEVSASGVLENLESNSLKWWEQTSNNSTFNI